MNFSIKLWHKVLILIAVPLAFEVAFIAILLNLLNEGEIETRRLNHAKAVIACAGDIMREMDRTFLSLFMYLTTSADSALTSYSEAVDELPKDSLRLRELVKEDSHESMILARVESMQTENIRILQEVKSRLGQHDTLGGFWSLTASRKSARKLAQMSVALQEIVRLEKAKGATDEKEESLRRQLKQCLIGGVGFNVLLAILLGAFFITGTTRRLSILMANTLHLSGDVPLLPSVGGSDEIAHLDKVFRDMAEDLAEASRKERAVVENAQDVICLIDGSNKFAKVNPICARVWGYEPSEIVGIRLAEIVVPEDLESTLAAFDSTKTGTNTASFENRIKHKQGTIVYMVWSVYWSEQSLFCVAHDITDRKESEARIRALIDNMPVGLVVVDNDCIIESSNPKTEELFGCSEKGLIGKGLLQLVSIENASSPESFIDKIKNDALGPLSGCLRKADEELHLELSLREFETAVGRRNLVSIQDVTERHRLEELKQEFVAMIAHDLRTPLTSIAFTLELMAKTQSSNLPDEWRKRLLATENNCARLVVLISDLLDLEKLRSGKFEVFLQTCNLSELIESSFESVHGFAEQNRIDLKIQKTEASVLAARERIVQVLVNLLSNAIKFSPEGSAVSVETISVDDFAEIRIIDHGRGIPESKLDQIFDRFSQVSKKDAYAKGGGGSGLGLTISKAIIEAHGGKIGVESCEGSGSTFWFRIPLA